MWDKQDNFSRWVQGICAIPLLAWMFFATRLLLGSGYFGSFSRGGSAIASSVIGAGYLSYRCLWYAITGENCINRDDY